MPSPGVFRKPFRRRPRRRQRRWQVVAGYTALAAGTLSFVSSGPAGITLSATDATGGTPAYTYQLQRSVNGGAYSNLSNGGGVTGATTLAPFDGSATAGNAYRYKMVYTDAAAGTATSAALGPVYVYTGGALTGGGGLVGPSALVS